MTYDFTWSMLLEAPYLDWIEDGVATTLSLGLLAWVIALALGLVIGIGRTLRPALPRLFCACYVELFRNVPLLVQLFLWLYVAPLLLPPQTRLWWNRLDSGPFWTSVIALSFYTSARLAEQIRAALGAIPPGQYRAALSTGLTVVQAYRYVILPYAVRIVIPAITAEFVTIFKNTALTLTIGVMEISAVSRKIEAWSFKGIEAYSAASATYIATTLVVVLVMGWIERRAVIPGLIHRPGEVAT
jgi:glutamate/aspartate transport system permease protein